MPRMENLHLGKIHRINRMERITEIHVRVHICVGARRKQSDVRQINSLIRAMLRSRSNNLIHFSYVLTETIEALILCELLSMSNQRTRRCESNAQMPEVGEIMLDVHNQRTISGDSIRFALRSFARAENDRNCRDLSLLRRNFRLVLA